MLSVDSGMFNEAGSPVMAVSQYSTISNIKTVIILAFH